MAELSLREQLQPGLIDRLSDDERFVSVIQLRVAESELTRLQINIRALVDILSAQKLRHSPTLPEGATPAPAGEVDVYFTAAGRSVGLQQLRELIVKPPGAPKGVAMQSFCHITARALLNLKTEGMDRSFFTMKRLRDSVFRDLEWLLNANNAESVEDLEKYPEVRRSVYNYGLPSLAGKPSSSINVDTLAEEVAAAISFFEPRLSQVRVTPEGRIAGTDSFSLSFQVEAELWGQPLPQHIVVRTSIDLDTGVVSVSDAMAG
jgi:type VI secretion system protein ImpF